MSSMSAATSIAVFQNDEMRKIILAFLPFEQQATQLRLVSRTFKATAEQLLEEKLFETVKVIGFDQWQGGGWFKATVRRGWSEECCGSPDACVEDALWLSSCRCCTRSGDCVFNKGGIGSKESCGEKVVEEGYCDGVQHWDMHHARELLRSQGWFRITNGLPDGSGSSYLRRDEPSVQVSFKRGGTNSLYDFLRAVLENIDREVSYELIPDSFQRFYGLDPEDGAMSSSRFLRLVFIVFQKGTAPLATATPGQKEPSISMVTSLIDDNSDRYSRRLMYFRFYSTTNEPIEIRLQSKHYIS